MRGHLDERGKASSDVVEYAVKQYPHSPHGRPLN